MMRPGPDVQVYLCVTLVDMRRQANGLALLVEQALKRDVFAPALYGFTNKKRDRIRIVYWERNGLCLWSKRLERRDRFIRPTGTSGESVSMTGRELNALLDGFDVVGHGHRSIEMRRVG